MAVIDKAVMLGTMALLASSCGPRADAPNRNGMGRDAASLDTAANAPSPPSPATSAPTEADNRSIAGRPPVTLVPLLGEKVVRAQWRKAANRARCAPLGLRSDARARGVPRPATFSGGWAVAFDQPDRRSAYGFAGVGALPDDRLDFAVLVDQLATKWPYIRRWDAGDNLPAGSAAGYGLEGFKDYPPGSSGYGQQSVAYLRIPRQQCLYNIWSRLGRDHLELLLGELVELKP